MKQIFVRRAVIVAATILTGFTSCHALAEVSADKIEQRTAFTLGLEKGAFTIFDLVDEGIRTNYAVKTNTGKKYNCYVTSAPSILGSVVSDAICQEIGRAAKQETKTDGSACNALLKAAGKC